MTGRPAGPLSLPMRRWNDMKEAGIWSASLFCQDISFWKQKSRKYWRRRRIPSRLILVKNGFWRSWVEETITYPCQGDISEKGKPAWPKGRFVGMKVRSKKSTDINVWRIWTAGWISIREKDSGLALKLYQRAKIVFPNRKCGQDKKFQKHLW